MDKHILFVKSDVDSTKALKNKDLVSFHKQPRMCFNATTLEKCRIYAGMYARFMMVNHNSRRIILQVAKEEDIVDKKKWYKITNPKVSKYNRYCYIRTTNLLFDHEMLLLGAFEYEANENYIVIKF